MNAATTTKATTAALPNRSQEQASTPLFTAPQTGHPLAIGDGFTASSFRERDYGGAMDPLVMVDHYRMMEPTFGPHPHAGLSAVSILFEDSIGRFHNRDSLGNDIDLMPGDLYWLKAGSGAIHDEKPVAGASTHGLQVFVNLPSSLKSKAPESLHVKASDMPLLQSEGYRVRLVLGRTNGTAGRVSPALPMTILDGTLAAGSTFSHDLQAGENAWIYALKGELELVTGNATVRLRAGEAVALNADAIEAIKSRTLDLTNQTHAETHFALLAAEPVNEDFVQKGPFVMNNHAEIARIEADYAAGMLGSLPGAQSGSLV